MLLLRAVDEEEDEDEDDDLPMSLVEALRFRRPPLLLERISFCLLFSFSNLETLLARIRF